MMFMKIIGCILVIGSSSGMGFFFSNEIRYRIENLKELRKLIGLLRGDIRYANTPLPEAISSITRRHNGSYNAFFNHVSTKLHELSGHTFAEIWKEAVNKELADTSLSNSSKPKTTVKSGGAMVPPYLVFLAYSSSCHRGLGSSTALTKRFIIPFSISYSPDRNSTPSLLLSSPEIGELSDMIFLLLDWLGCG